MKVTLKEFLKEQVSKGIDVPKIYEDITVDGNGELVNRDSQDFDFEMFYGTPLDGPAVESECHNLITQFIQDLYGQEELIKREGAQLDKVFRDQALDNLQRLFVQRIESIKNGEWNEGLLEGFFDKIKNVVSGTIEYNTANNYAGSPEAQAFVVKDKRAKVQIDTLTKKGMTPEEAKAAVMFVFDKSDKNPLGFMGKTTEYDPQTKTMKVESGGMNNPNLMA